MRQGEVPVTFADVSKAQRIIGYQPKVKFEDGIKKFIEWYKVHAKIEDKIQAPRLFERLREKF